MDSVYSPFIISKLVDWPMLQMSKLLGSREEWKNKAVQRAEEIREYRKTKKRHQAKISELKAQIAQLELVTPDKKTLD